MIFSDKKRVFDHDYEIKNIIGDCLDNAESLLMQGLWNNQHFVLHLKFTGEKTNES